MRPLRPVTTPTATYPAHRRLHLRRAGVAITVLLVAGPALTACGTSDLSTHPEADTGVLGDTATAQDTAVERDTAVETREPDTAYVDTDEVDTHGVDGDTAYADTDEWDAIGDTADWDAVSDADDTGGTDTAIVERVEHRAPETGEAYYDYVASYHVVLQVPADQLDAVQREEALILSAAEEVIPTDCMEWEEQQADDDAVAAFVNALPRTWQIGAEHAEIYYICEMPMAGDMPDGEW